MEGRIFISYSRKDLDAVKPIKEELEASGFSCWMDLEGIESGSYEFTDYIANAIEQSSVLLFFLSGNSQRSRWSLNELRVARDDEKHVVLIRFNKDDMTTKFKLEFGGADVIDWRRQEQKAKLVRDLTRWLGCESSSIKAGDSTAPLRPIGLGTADSNESETMVNETKERDKTSVHDIFISYRRDGGFETAKYLYDNLTRDGYSVTFDIDTLRNGRFDEALLSRIDECKDFILVLSRGCFDRTLDPNCPRENDWMRQELAHALATKKNVVPIMLDGFGGFPAGLPDDIKDVARFNGPSCVPEYIDSFYERLKAKFLVSGQVDFNISDDRTAALEGLQENVDEAAKLSMPIMEWVKEHKRTTIVFLPLIVCSFIVSMSSGMGFGFTCMGVLLPIVALAYLCSRNLKKAIAIFLTAIIVSTALWVYFLPDEGPILAIVTIAAISVSAIVVTSPNFRIK